MQSTECLLILDGKDLRTGDCFHCDKCGWNPEVEERRKEYARRHGLRTGRDALRYIPANPK